MFIFGPFIEVLDSCGHFSRCCFAVFLDQDIPNDLRVTALFLGPVLEGKLWRAVIRLLSYELPGAWCYFFRQSMDRRDWNRFNWFLFRNVIVLTTEIRNLSVVILMKVYVTIKTISTVGIVWYMFCFKVNIKSELLIEISAMSLPCSSGKFSGGRCCIHL